MSAATNPGTHHDQIKTRQGTMVTLPKEYDHSPGIINHAKPETKVTLVSVLSKSQYESTSDL